MHGYHQHHHRHHDVDDDQHVQNERGQWSNQCDNNRQHGYRNRKLAYVLQRQLLPDGLREGYGLRLCRHFNSLDLCMHLAAHHLVYVGKDLGHGAIELGRDGPADCNRAVKGPSQGRVLDDGNFILDGNLAHPQCQPVLPFSNHNGAWHRFHVVLDSHCEVSRVDNDCGCFRNLSHHLPTEQFATQALDLSLYLWITFVSLVLFFDFFLAHLERGHMFSVLAEQIGAAKQNKNGRRFPQQALRHGAYFQHGDRQGLKRQSKERRRVLAIDGTDRRCKDTDQK